MVCLVSGGNIDVTSLNRVINRGLMMSGRMCTLTVELSDKPGQLVKVSQIVAETGANVIGVRHERTGIGEAVNGCLLHVYMETRNQLHVEEIRERLQAAGFRLIEH